MNPELRHETNVGCLGDPVLVSRHVGQGCGHRAISLCRRRVARGEEPFGRRRRRAQARRRLGSRQGGGAQRHTGPVPPARSQGRDPAHSRAGVRDYRNSRTNARGGDCTRRVLHCRRAGARRRISRRHGRGGEPSGNARRNCTVASTASLHPPVRTSRNPGAADPRADCAIRRPSRLPVRWGRYRARRP